MSNGAEIRKAFVAYLAGHRRPIVELLQPNRNAIEDQYANHFAGMTDEPVELAELEATRTQLFEWASTVLTEHECGLRLSIKQGEADWVLLPFEGLDQWPGIQWKTAQRSTDECSQPQEALRFNPIEDLCDSPLTGRAEFLSGRGRFRCEPATDSGSAML